MINDYLINSMVQSITNNPHKIDMYMEFIVVVCSKSIEDILHIMKKLNDAQNFKLIEQLSSTKINVTIGLLYDIICMFSEESYKLKIIYILFNNVHFVYTDDDVKHLRTLLSIISDEKYKFNIIMKCICDYNYILIDKCMEYIKDEKTKHKIFRIYAQRNALSEYDVFAIENIIERNILNNAYKQSAIAHTKFSRKFTICICGYTYDSANIRVGDKISASINNNKYVITKYKNNKLYASENGSKAICKSNINII